jgi:hypothetical protein
MPMQYQQMPPPIMHHMHPPMHPAMHPAMQQQMPNMQPPQAFIIPHQNQQM